MYISAINDSQIVLDRSDYTEPFQLKESSFRKILDTLDNTYRVFNDVKFELADLEVDKFVSYLRYRYLYSDLKFLFCESWLLDEV